jgi:hypothetical protein
MPLAQKYSPKMNPPAPSFTSCQRRADVVMVRLPELEGFESLDKHLEQMESSPEMNIRLDIGLGWSIVRQWMILASGHVQDIP